MVGGAEIYKAMKKINITITSDLDFTLKVDHHSSFLQMESIGNADATFYGVDLKDYADFMAYLQTALEGGDQGRGFIDCLKEVNLTAVEGMLTSGFFSMQLDHGIFYIEFSNRL